jgi:hypothetical protein
MSGRRLPFGMIFSSSRGEKPINFSTLGVGAHSRSIRNRVVRHVFNDSSLNYKIPDIPCKPITGLELLIDVSGTLQLSEDYASDTFTVALNKAPLVDTKVSLVVNDTTEAEVSVSEITFTPENYYKPVTITVTGKDDLLADGTINTFVSISLVGEDEEKIKFVYVENQDNESSDMLTITGINNLRIDANEGVILTQIVYFAMASEPISETVFNIDIQSGFITPSQNNIVFNVGDWTVPKPVEFTLNKPDDEVADGDITEEINIREDNINYSKTITVIFTEDDILESNIDSGEGILYEDTSLTVDISLNKEPVSDVNLSVFSANNERLGVAPANLTFTTANYATPQTLTLTSVDNGILDAPETVDISLTFVGGGNDNITYTSQKKFTVDLYDSIKEILTEFSSVTMDEGSSLDFDISLSTRPVQDIQIILSSTNELKPIAPLTFTSANWNTPQTVTLEANESNSVNDQTDILVIATDAGFETANIPITVSNVNNSINITFSTPNINVDEGGSSQTIDLSLNSQPSDSVTLSFNFSADGYTASDLSFAPINDITLATTDWNSNTQITVDYPDEDAIYSDISVNLNVTATSNDSDYNTLSRSVLINLINTGAAPNTELTFSKTEMNVQEGSSDTFDLSLSSLPSSSVTVTFTVSATGYSASDLSFADITDITFTTADWDTEKASLLNYPTVDRYYNDISVNLNASTTSADSNYNGISKDLLVNLYNTDVPLVDLSRNISVGVSNDGNGNKYYIDDDNDTNVEYAPTLTLHQGSAYKFSQDDGSNATHQLQISETDNGTHNGGTEYTLGTKYKGTANSPEFTEFVVPIDNTLDKLYYYCVNHSGMGGNLLLARDYNSGAGFYFNVTVAGGVFNINGLAQETVVLLPGTTYYFDQSEGTNATHPIKFASSTDGTALATEAGKWTISDNAGTAGTDLITSIEIDATYADANIFYACQNHNGMGGSIKYLR